MERRNGSRKASCLRNGLRQVRFYGSMERVRPLSISLRSLLTHWPSRLSAGSGKSVIWYVPSLVRMCVKYSYSISSSIIQQVKTKCDRGLALMGYYYFDFKDIAKQGIRGLLTSLLSQFCAKSDPCNEVLSDLYSENDAGSRQPTNKVLTESLIQVLRLPHVPTRYIILDGIDECPNTSGFPTAREEVLKFLKELIGLILSNLRTCITSRPEIDI
jgi:hypothetical protein